MFYGQYEHSVDNKGRLIIPAKFREALRDAFVDKFMITRGLEGCIFLFPLTEWHNLEQKIKNLPFMTGSKARAFTRMLFSGASEGELDKQGRVLLPLHLREHARLEKEAVITGVSNHVEIWSKENWGTYLKKEKESFDATAEQLMGFGI